MRKVVFGISERHIENGIAWQCEKCPGALAILDRVAPKVHVAVDEYLVCLTRKPDGGNLSDVSRESFSQEVPEDLSDFSYRFDRRRRGVPIDFVLEVPEWAYSDEKAIMFNLMRTPVRVTAVNRNQGWFEVELSAWDPVERVRLKKEHIPEEVFLRAAPEKRFYARVNIDHKDKDALHFVDWENA